MTTQAVFNRLVTRENFKLATELAVGEDLQITPVLEHGPEINVYWYGEPKPKAGTSPHHSLLAFTTHLAWTSNGDDSAWWLELSPENNHLSFWVPELNAYRQGVQVFFTYYAQITEFRVLNDLGDWEFVQVQFRYYYTEDDHYEISYDFHSLGKPAYRYVKSKTGVELLTQYYLEGEYQPPATWGRLSRTQKLSRILGNSPAQP